MSRRRLRPEELELWQQVAKSADRLPGKRAPLSDPDVRPKAKPPSMREALPAFELGTRSLPPTETHDFSGTTSDRLSRESLRMDHKAFGKLKRGKLVPEARMDLHGMTLDQAHPALLRFVMGAHARGLRLVLVITGKGSREDPHDPMPRRRGVLKTQVPLWLRMPPVASVVLQVAEAHIRHGGTGAYYVYLKRPR